MTGQAVHTVCNGDIPDIVLEEEDFNISAGFNIISSQSVQVFCDDATNFTNFNISDHTLKRRAIEIATCVAIIHIILMLKHSIFLCKVPKHDFLIADAHALIITTIIQRNAAIEICDFLVFSFSCFFLLILNSFYELRHNNYVIPCHCYKLK